MAQMPQPESNPPRQEPPPPSPEPDPFGNVPDDDWVTAGAARQLLRNQNERFAPIVEGMKTLYQGQVDTLETNSRILNPDLWEKYGDEVRREIEEAKQTQVVTGKTYEKAIQIVRGRHVDEIAKEKAEALLRQSPPGDIAGGGEAGVPAGAPAGPEVPDAWKELFKEHGITMADIESTVRMRREWGETDFTVEKYLQELANHQVIRDGRGKIMADDLTEKKNA